MIYSDMFEPEISVEDPPAPELDPPVPPVPPEPEPPEPEPVPPEPELPEPELPVPPLPLEMRPRFDRHKPFNDIQAAYWVKFIERHPFRFDALLYRADPIESDTLADDYEQAEFKNVDIRQTEPTYQDPVLVAVLDTPDELETFSSMDAGGENAIDTGSVTILQIADDDVPIGSVLEWVEETADGKGRRVWWYVHRAGNYGSTKAGTLYFCIPCRTFDGVITNA